MDWEYRNMNGGLFRRKGRNGRWLEVPPPSATLHAKCIHCYTGATISRKRFEEDGQSAKSNEPYGMDFNGYICDKCANKADEAILDGLLLSYEETGEIPLVLKIYLEDKEDDGTGLK